MGTPREPKPVKLFAALLCNEESLFEPVREELVGLFGPVDLASEILPWNVTNYYAPEMGPRLYRRFVSFNGLMAPDQLSFAKLSTGHVEETYGQVKGGRTWRRVNVDPGYLGTGKVVLASTKDAFHRLYLGSGIFAEVTLIYHRGNFQPLSHTYADYRWSETLSFFVSMRSRYLAQLNSGRAW